MNFLELAGQRYSVRKYTEQPVEPEKLALILEAGRLAPTAKNLQPQRIYVLQSDEALAKLAALTHCGYGAKTVLLFAYDETEEWKHPSEAGVHAGVEDVSIVATHIMLEAADLGLGSCWCNMFPNAAVERAFGLPETERTVLVMPIGYPAMGPGPLHEKSRPLDETVRYL